MSERIIAICSALPGWYALVGDDPPDPVGAWALIEDDDGQAVVPLVSAEWGLQPKSEGSDVRHFTPEQLEDWRLFK